MSLVLSLECAETEVGRSGFPYGAGKQKRRGFRESERGGARVWFSCEATSSEVSCLGPALCCWGGWFHGAGPLHCWLVAEAQACAQGGRQHSEAASTAELAVEIVYAVPSVAETSQRHWLSTPGLPELGKRSSVLVVELWGCCARPWAVGVFLETGLGLCSGCPAVEVWVWVGGLGPQAA